METGGHRGTVQANGYTRAETGFRPSQAFPHTRTNFPTIPPLPTLPNSVLFLNKS
jgi:hypothetical protein